MIIDTHTHIFESEFDLDRNDVILRAKDNGVLKMVIPNINVESIPRLKSLAESDTSTFFPAMGLHPTELGESFRDDLDIIHDELLQNRYYAVGEIGLDFYWDDNNKSDQIDAFSTQLQWAAELDLPVLIHCRNAFADAIQCVKDSKCRRGIFHCFSGSKQEADEILSLGDFKLGIGGVVTYKNSTLPQTLKSIGLENIVVETDAPYLAPVPHRGKRNEPAFLYSTVSKLAEIYNTTKEQIENITSQNAVSILNLT